MSLGQIIRARREELGLTQDQLALQSGISKPYLSNIETGRTKNPPSDKVLRSLEGSLRFQPDQLTRIAHLVRTPVDVRHEQELLKAEVEKLRSVIKQMLLRRQDDGGAGETRQVLPSYVEDLGKEKPLAGGVAIPLINTVAAGYPGCSFDLDQPARLAEEYVRCPDLHDPQAFALRVVDDSMEPEYRQGDVVVFSPAATPMQGDDCLARLKVHGGTAFKRFYRDADQLIRLQPVNSKYPAQRYRPEEITGLWPAVFRIQRVRPVQADRHLSNEQTLAAPKGL